MQHTITRSGIRYSGERRDEILEIEQHTCRLFDPKCWLDLSIVAIVFGGAILGSLIIIARMWIILGEQVAAL